MGMYEKSEMGWQTRFEATKLDEYCRELKNFMGLKGYTHEEVRAAERCFVAATMRAMKNGELEDGAHVDFCVSGNDESITASMKDQEKMALRQSVAKLGMYVRRVRMEYTYKK